MPIIYSTDTKSLEEIKGMPGYITFRQSLDVFKIAREELLELVSKMEELANFKADDEFIDTLDYLIVLYREKIRNDKSIPPQIKEKNYLDRIEKSANKLISVLNEEGISQERVKSLMVQTMLKSKLIDENDCMFYSNLHANKLLSVCRDTKAEYKNLINGTSINDFRLTLAEELARELDRLGVHMPKVKDGNLENCFKELINVIPCNKDNIKIHVSFRDDYSKLIIEAINNFKEKERETLLSFV